MTTNYKKVNFILSNFQAKKIKHAIDSKIGVTLRLNKSLISETGIPLLLTESEVSNLSDGKQHHIHFSVTRLEELKKTGGFLPLLAAAIPWIVKGATVAAGATSAIKTVKDMIQGKGIISDLNIPVISNLAKKVGLGTKKGVEVEYFYIEVQAVYF